MLYVILADDAPGSEARRAAARAAHMARMAQMEESGRLVISGPRLRRDLPEPAAAGIAGSLIIAEFESLQAAREWADADAYVAAGVWTNVTVQPFHRGFGGLTAPRSDDAAR
jgi:uncharacterized protein YciI